MEPKIRLKGFSEDWKETTYGESVTINSGMDYKHLSIGEIPVYGTGGYMLSVNESLSDTDAIGIGRKGTIDKPQLLKAPFWTVDTLFFMTPQKGVNLNFLFALSQKTNWRKYDESTGVPSLSKVNIAKIDIRIPKEEEQKAIASYFSSLDALIQSTTKKIESLKKVKAASLQSMFPHEGETMPRVRFKGFEGEWEMVLVGNLGTTYSGLSGKTKDDFGSGEARFITFLNVLTNAKIDTTILEAVNVSDGEHQNEVKKGDLLFNTSSETPEEVGMCAVMDEDISDVYLNSFCFGFRVTDVNVDPTFIAYLMRSHVGRRIMSILAQGATRYNLSKNNFCNAELLLPKTKKEQSLISNYFVSLDSQIALQTQRLEKLKQIKSACLDNMFV